jgi:hypothetical protein
MLSQFNKGSFYYEGVEFLSLTTPFILPKIQLRRVKRLSEFGSNLLSGHNKTGKITLWCALAFTPHNVDHYCADVILLVCALDRSYIDSQLPLSTLLATSFQQWPRSFRLPVPIERMR